MGNFCCAEDKRQIANDNKFQNKDDDIDANHFDIETTMIEGSVGLII